jgi:hypothetical protein
MTDVANVLLVLAIPLAAVGVGLMMGMVGALHVRGHRINWVLLRLYIPAYVSRYLEITKRESGRPGSLFYPFVVSMNLALVLVIVGALIHVA